MPPRVRVVAKHEPPDHGPIRIEPGEVVTAGSRDDEWPAFVWVTRADGAGGWVPYRYLEQRGGDRAFVSQRYDTTELCVALGDEVDLLVDDPESGWACDHILSRGHDD